MNDDDDEFGYLRRTGSDGLREFARVSGRMLELFASQFPDPSSEGAQLIETVRRHNAEANRLLADREAAR